MMFGLRHRFEYAQCGACGCLQLLSPPEDLSPYYPDRYYSFEEADLPGGVRGALRRVRDRHALQGKGRLGRLLSLVYPYRFLGASEWLRRTRVSYDSRVLDVGCGSGKLLRELRGLGFRHLVGIDPFLDGDEEHGPGCSLLSRDIHAVEGRFDLIMFHHSLEHIADQVRTLERAAELLAPGGSILIRVPTVSSFAWEHYREHWVQLDAPRHFFLHSVESLETLAGRVGLSLVHVQDDSTELQFAGSELYRRDIPLLSGPWPFSRSEMRSFRRRAHCLNEQRRGDQAAFYLRAAR